MKMPPARSIPELKREIQKIMLENPDVYEGHTIASYHKKHPIQFQMRCPYGHIYNSSLSKMSRLYGCCTEECKTESYNRRAAKGRSTWVAKAANETETLFKTPLWAGYVLVNVFSKAGTGYVGDKNVSIWTSNY